MHTALDLAIDATVKRLMSDDGPLSVTPITKYGVQMPMFSKAPANLADFYSYFCDIHADKEFIVDGDARLTFGDCYKAARALAGGLVQGHGLKKGDRVGIAARNSANWMIANIAITLAGGVSTLLNGWWTGTDANKKIMNLRDSQQPHLKKAIRTLGRVFKPAIRDSVKQLRLQKEIAEAGAVDACIRPPR